MTLGSRPSPNALLHMWPQDLLFRFVARAKRFLLANSMVVGFTIGTIWALTSPGQGKAVSSLKMGDFRAIEFFNNCMVGGHAGSCPEALQPVTPQFTLNLPTRPMQLVTPWY